MGCEATPDGGPAARIAAVVPRQRLHEPFSIPKSDLRNQPHIRPADHGEQEPRQQLCR